MSSQQCLGHLLYLKRNYWASINTRLWSCSAVTPSARTSILANQQSYSIGVLVKPKVQHYLITAGTATFVYSPLSFPPSSVPISLSRWSTDSFAVLPILVYWIQYSQHYLNNGESKFGRGDNLAEKLHSVRTDCASRCLPCCAHPNPIHNVIRASASLMNNTIFYRDTLQL